MEDAATGRGAATAEDPETAGGPPGAPPARARLVFPAVVLALFAALVLGGVHGSSIGALAPRGDDPSLVAGEPRPIRSDEYLIQTANSVGNVRRGLDTDPWFGLVQVDQAVATLGAPSKDWSEVLRPHDWGYFVGASFGLAWHWWFAFLAALLGLYALLLGLVRSVPLAAAMAAVGALTPYTAWWTSPSTALLLGYATSAGAAAVAALRAARAAETVALSVLAGLLAAALALTVYPPWIVVMSVIVAAVVVGQAIDLRAPWRRVALVGSLAGVSAVVPLGAWFLQHRAAISAISHTSYPGGRRSEAGEAWLSNLLSAPLNPWLAGDAGATLVPRPGATGYAVYVNLSEAASSWFPVGVLVVVLALVAALTLRRQGPAGPGDGGGPTSGAEGGGAPRLMATFWAVAAATALVVCWALLPLPSPLGAVTLLNRVPSYRTPLAMSLGAVLLTVLAGELLRRRRLGMPATLLLAAGAALSGVGAMWSARRLNWDVDLVSLPLALASGLVVGCGFAVVASGRWRTVAAALLAAYCAMSWALVNPVYRGLGPLNDDAVVVAMRAVEEDQPGTVVAVYGDGRLGALVAASGAQNLSGTTFYPDPEVMRLLAPEQKDLWNNYANYRWVADETQHPARIEQVRGTQMDLRIDPCAPETLSLGMSWTLSLEAIDAPCLRRVDRLRSDLLGTVHRYRVVSRGAGGAG